MRVNNHSFERYADVTQALHSPALLPHGSAAGDTAPHLALREAVGQALAPARLASWRSHFAGHAQALVEVLAEGVPVDLVAAYAEPWALELALTVTGAPREQGAQCEALARQIYLAAADARDGTPAAEALAAAAALARVLSSPAARSGAMSDVQTFVALSQSLPALLAGAWHALLCHPVALADLFASASSVAGCVGELLRLGSPARAVFRVAVEDLVIGHTRVRRGDRVALLLWAANRDPDRFADPELLDPARDTAGHLSLGAGLHPCAGAHLVRMAVVIATQALLARCASLAWADGAEVAVGWRGGFAMRAPAALPVVRWRVGG